MRKLAVFNHVSLDGFFVDGSNGMSWAHGGRTTQDPEWDAFVAENAGGNSTLLFGRVTYELMAGYWPTPLAAKNDAVVAQRMNQLPKVVFSRTLQQASWSNTRLVRNNLAAEVRKMKNEPGESLVIFGSGNIISQLASEGLIDEYQFVVNPLVLGQGRTMFSTITQKVNLKLVRSRAFRNGNVYLCYESGS